MANKKITELPYLEALSNDDVFYVVDVSDLTESGDGTSKKFRFREYYNLFTCTEAGNQTLTVPLGLRFINVILNNGRVLKKTYEWSGGGNSTSLELYFDFEIDDQIYITGIY